MSKQMSNNWPAWLPLRPDLADQVPYGAPQLDLPVRLNTNENPFGPSRALVKDLERAISEIGSQLNRYPDREAQELRRALARYINELSDTRFDERAIWVANGSNEIIQTIFLAFGGHARKALGFEPSYSMHRNIARSTGTEWVALERFPDYSVDVESAAVKIQSVKPGLVFLTTPNNPTGTVTALSDIEKLAQLCREQNALLVVDEAYQEFSSELSAVTIIERYPNILVSRTMSKAFAFAGTRVGYLVADVKVIEALQLVRLPYHLSAATQALALVALSYSQELLGNVALLSKERERVREALTKRGVKTIASGANFFLFESANPGQLWKVLVSAGVLIRDVGLTNSLRVTIGTPEENDRFITAINAALTES